jgi:hypothetical protein
VAHLEVDPAALTDTAVALKRCVGVAAEVAHHHRNLTVLVSDCGSDRLRSATEHFLGRWGHGMGLVEKDADELVKQLESAAAEYRALEVRIAEEAK